METPVNNAPRHPKKQGSLKIEVSQYNSVMRLLGDHRSVWRLIATLCLLMLVLFTGLSIVTLVIKQMYPYHDIKTNVLGATTVRDESTEITYWLFNTAELWADTGIHVEEGDVLTIRASGKSHTAIHHLIRDVERNVKLQDNWVDTSGDIRHNDTDKARSAFRIFGNSPQDALVMQVVPEDERDKIYDPEYFLRPMGYSSEPELKDEDRKKHRENFYLIGKERVKLRINHAGTLRFAVNDIPLTKRVIYEMLCKEYNVNAEDSPNLFQNRDKFHKWYDAHIEGQNQVGDLKLGKYKGDSIYYQHKNELLFYYDMEYVNAWYDDNIGSFLVVIERERKN